jgi:hypothetical protein
VNQATMLKVAARLYRGEAITTEILRNRYRCSAAAAKRAMNTLRQNLPVTVTKGDMGRVVLRIDGSAPRQAVSVPAVKLPPRAVGAWMQL